MSNLLRNPIARMKLNSEVKTPINKIAYEINEQDLVGKSGAGVLTAVQLTLAKKCGGYFTASFECTTNNVSCG